MGETSRVSHQPRIIDRYAMYDEIASGGMAVVHFGRLLTQTGFARTVALKRLRPEFAGDPHFVAMFLDEARLAGRVLHPNVVAPLDVVVLDDELFVVMEYVSGETLAELVRRCSKQANPIPPAIAARIMSGALHGLHAAHEAVSEDGVPLDIVHRDVSPQNIMIGLDGVTRVLDFGVAKATMQSHVTRNGEVKGKIAYMAPEQIVGGAIDRRVDVFAAGTVLWEALTSRRLFRHDDMGQTLGRLLHHPIEAPSTYSRAVPPSLDSVVLKALRRIPDERYRTARDFAVALEEAIVPASPSVVGDWVKQVGGTKLRQRIDRVSQIESSSHRISVSRVRLPSHSGVIGHDESLAREVAADLGIEKELASAESASSNRVSKVRSIKNSGLRPLRHLGKRGQVGLAVVAGLLLFVGVLVARRDSVAKTEHNTAASEPSPNAKASIATTALVTTSTERVEPVPRDTEPDTRASANAPAAPAPTVKEQAAAPVAAAAAPPRQAARAVRSPAKRTKPIRRQGCDPPYTIDENGIRRLNTECM